MTTLVNLDRFFVVVLIGLVWAFFPGASCAQQMIDKQLLELPSETLLQKVQQLGDARRGAILFYSPSMNCIRCHAVEADDHPSPGPRLSQPVRKLTASEVAEAILEPSKTIRDEFRTVSIQTHDDTLYTGLIVEQSDLSVTLRDIQRIEIKLDRNEIQRSHVSSVSMMPAGLVNTLNDFQGFYDLVRYVCEIQESGSQRATDLKPTAAMLAQNIPEYESNLDHQSFMRDWNEQSFERGQAIYQRVCANCHGTQDRQGSLPTALRFGQGAFKNGNDPFSMYKTITYGFGFMGAQSWMVPSQKYDVIHFIQEAYLRQNPTIHLTAIDERYFATIPKGDARGPEPSTIEPWSAMDYGPTLTHTYQIPDHRENFAYKGIGIRLDPGPGGISRGHDWMLFDTDTLRMAAAWSVPVEPKTKTSFIDWRGIQLNGEHQIHPTIVGDLVASIPTGPGWASPNGSFEDDQRVVGRDKRHYGPLPRDWAKFHGQYRFGSRVILSYSVGTTDILESPSITPTDDPAEPVFTRSFSIGPRTHPLALKIAENEPGAHVLDHIHVAIQPESLQSQCIDSHGKLVLTLPAGETPLHFKLGIQKRTRSDPTNGPRQQSSILNTEIQDLKPWTQGGPAQWNQPLVCSWNRGNDDGPIAADTISIPETNPWLAQLRLTGLDFFSDGQLAVCTWDGDVWKVAIDDDTSKATWTRIATGLFQPLGIRVIQDTIHVLCRDQLVRLHDLNADGEIDFYECVNNDQQVTDHFHEFAMGLQTDDEGNFYYARSARHALPALVPHHGTLLRISSDGLRTDILANGFRAANGVCLNPDGSFYVTDQEGHWNPKNRINWIAPFDPERKNPRFYGNMFGYHDNTDPSDDAMEPPLCWITNAFDRSPGELMWTDSESWGPFNHRLLNLSYGTGKVFLVLEETVDGMHQGGMIPLPIAPFPTGVMRGRFHPKDHSLYLCGMFAWAGDATAPGGLYRLRKTSIPLRLPTELHATKSGIEIVFPFELSDDSAQSKNISIQTWSLKRSDRYGSDHIDEQTRTLGPVRLSNDRRTLLVDVDGMSPTWCMKIEFDLLTKEGAPVRGVINNTVHRLDAKK